MADDHGNDSSDEIIPPNGGISVDLVVEAYAQEYESLDNTLNEIDSWMTKLEQQNDNLNAELDILLESSRQTRKELLEQNKQSTEEMDTSEGQDDKKDKEKE